MKGYEELLFCFFCFRETLRKVRIFQEELFLKPEASRIFGKIIDPGETRKLIISAKTTDYHIFPVTKQVRG